MRRRGRACIGARNSRACCIRAALPIVGASSRAGSFGERVLDNLAGYTGNVHLVNAKYDRLGERPCHPEPVGAARKPGLRRRLRAARRRRGSRARSGASAAGGVILFASGYAETGKADRIAQQTRLVAIAAESGLRILGPNCLGIANYSLGARITFSEYPAPRALRAGVRRHREPVGRAVAVADAVDGDAACR